MKTDDFVKAVLGLLQILILGISSWALTQILDLKLSVARVEQKLEDHIHESTGKSSALHHSDTNLISTASEIRGFHRVTTREALPTSSGTVHMPGI